MTRAPSLAILGYMSASARQKLLTPTGIYPARDVRDHNARGTVRRGEPYGWVGTCSACPSRVSYGSQQVTLNAILRHLRDRHLY